MRDIKIRVMQIKDVNKMVKVHLSSFSGFFLTFLGPAFLHELYTAIITDSSGIGHVYEDHNEIQGFVIGTGQPSGFYRRLLHQRWWRFGLASIKAVLKKPSIIPRLLRAVRMPQQAAFRSHIGTLMSIAVLPDAQGKGIGQALVQKFLQEAKQRGLTQVNLTTDRLDNDAVNSFYQKLGFSCIRHFVTPEGREMNEYIIDL
ncbi:MAG: GNAT family N-acetyltransferase [Ardenticatenaceae bacterium]